MNRRSSIYIPIVILGAVIHTEPFSRTCARRKDHAIGKLIGNVTDGSRARERTQNDCATTFPNPKYADDLFQDKLGSIFLHFNLNSANGCGRVL